MFLSKAAYSRYRVKRDSAELETMYYHLQESEKHDKENSFYNTQMALYHFCKNNKKYSTILRKKPPYEMCVEIEEFIYEIIDKEPDKGYLQWLLVLLTNYRGDYVLSTEALQKFEEIPELVLNDDMEKYIAKMKRYNRSKICFLQLHRDRILQRG